MMPVLGHTTYANLLKRELQSSPNVDYVAYFTNEDRELATRVINKLLRFRLPWSWVEKTNADMFFGRSLIGYSLFARRLLQRRVTPSATDVLYFHPQTVSLLATDYMTRFPTVISMDATAMQMATEKPAFAWSHLLDSAMERPAFERAAAIVSWSAWAARSVADVHGIPAGKIHVIPPGVDLSQFAGMDRTQCASSTPLRILFVGADFQRKGGPGLLEVFLSRFSGRDVELHLVTSERNIPVHPKIFVHNGITAYSEPWKRLYAGADVFVLPTKFDAFGLAFVEAMAAGIPAIGTDLNAIPEIIANDETGFLLPSGDGRRLAELLERLLEDASLRRRLGHNARTRASRLFDSAKNARTLEGLFVSAYREHRERRGHG